jgi:tripartite ATP-independent transporter DctP family solute receptor
MIKTRKNLKYLILSILSLCLLVACSPSSNNTSANEQTVLRYGYASNSEPVIRAMHHFGDLVEEKTNGEVVIDYYPDAQLGGETELIELTQTGAIDFAKVGGSSLEGFSSDYGIFSVPYIFDNEDHFFRVMESPDIIDPVYQSTKELGFVGLTYYDSGQRSFYMTDGPINHPDDLAGKKIRTMQSETAIAMVELLGASATPLGSDEVYTSMSSNLIDGAENNEFVLVTAGHGEIAKYYSYDEHTRVPDIVIANQSTLENLTEEQRTAVEEAAYESTEFQKEIFKEAVEEEKRIAAEEYDVEFNEVDKEPFIEKVQPLHEEYANSEAFGDLYHAIINESE